MLEGPGRPRQVDPVERAHLRDAQGFSPPVHRFAPSSALADVVRRYWLPVWSLPPGRTTVQRVLQYPVCLLVVAHDYARIVGPASGLSTKELSGSGWAAGAMLMPATGSLLLGGPVTITDSQVDLSTLSTLDGPALTATVRAAMAPAPDDPERQRAAVLAIEGALAALVPLDEESQLINAVVEYVEGDPRVQRVGQICEKFALTERTLQRLVARRIGLSPKWLIQRRRLHEAAELLTAEGDVDLARVAAELGYTDQAHFGRDWRRVTGVTPRAYAAQRRPS
ncbi:helix-turn-helix domain-containing protein [Nocardioides sp. cx-173]|uniref:helix-turn-helix domain-containing protein n=1 Tax=Nocardioides sp. cx-173 TaxID=2898796 RepID=UPI001E51DBDE|nr:helix-turn-helix domain-containing protein [Nocardioides sp. cx-173]MCD4527096.1 helix-turn-helix domain-containing protein [Nocardioides sp. cx-173]UGB42460.1 helix-turn-helix domain-containing protein [Nocardioides sp. cx-173]